MVKTVREVLSDTRSCFKSAGIDSANIDARLLIQDILCLKQEDLILRGDREIAQKELDQLESYKERRLAHEPVSRILGHRDFWKSQFKITTDTLDPRADSETLIDAVIKKAVSPKSILDLGTGSGCLLLSLLQELPEAKGVGLDIGKGAIAVASENAISLGLQDRSKFLFCDWSDFHPEEKFDIVISNPPYISEAEMELLEPNVIDYDPRAALVAGKDGLDAYRSIIALLSGLLKPSGAVFFEIGRSQAEGVTKMLEKIGFYDINLFTDIAGNDRCIVAHSP